VDDHGSVYPSAETIETLLLESMRIRVRTEIVRRHSQLARERMERQLISGALPKRPDVAQP
jgi:hypothetical protein